MRHRRPGRVVYRRCFACLEALGFFAEERCPQCGGKFHPQCLTEHLDRHAKGLPARPIRFECDGRCSRPESFRNLEGLETHLLTVHREIWL